MESIFDKTKGLVQEQRQMCAGLQHAELWCFKRLLQKQILQILTGHCNFQKHRNIINFTTTRSKSNREEKTTNHHVGERNNMQNSSKKKKISR